MSGSRQGRFYKFILISGFLCFSIMAFSQEKGPKKWSLGGYVKELQGLYLLNNPDFTLTDNLLHNRLNFKWFPNDHWKFRAELRTRFFWGEFVKFNPFFVEFVEDANNDIVDLSWVLYEAESFVLHTMLDRLSLQYSSGKLEIKLGRQRVNWGMGLIWNPNDWFNAYSFADFDYEERQGSDALSVKYYTGFASSVEIVSKVYTNLDEWTGAALWRFNRWKYDFQILGGFVERDVALGLGWAGNIGNAGFRGEASLFIPTPGSLLEESIFVGSLETDYAFNNGMYFGGAFLYSSSGESGNMPVNLLNSMNLSSKNLYPYKYSILSQWNYSISPILNLAFVAVYSPGPSNSLLLYPTFGVSIAENWDLNLVSQIGFSKVEDTYSSPYQIFFLRIKFSY